MLPLTLLTLGLIGQIGQVEVPTMQFTNRTGGLISVYIYFKDNRTWENNKRPLVIRGGATAAVPLREGNFQVVARNEYGVEDRNNRILAAQELDWMDFQSLHGKTQDGRPLKPQFKIVEHYKTP